MTGGAEGLRTLVFAIAHARLVDDLRRRARRGNAVSYETWHDERTTASTEDEAVDRIGAAEVQALLEELPADQRDVLVLRIVGDLSLEQTAEAIGRSTGAVKQLQRRGLLVLRDRLQKSGHSVSAVEAIP